MNRPKLLQFLFVLFIVLAVIFGIELIVTDWRSNVLAGIGLWCGIISQLMLAAVIFSEIQKEKKK
jgi:succinate-acetate transporter protein